MLANPCVIDGQPSGAQCTFRHGQGSHGRRLATGGFEQLNETQLDPFVECGENVIARAEQRDVAQVHQRIGQRGRTLCMPPSLVMDEKPIVRWRSCQIFPF